MDYDSKSSLPTGRQATPSFVKGGEGGLQIFIIHKRGKEGRSWEAWSRNDEKRCANINTKSN
jgi:hypothetical protein